MPKLLPPGPTYESVEFKRSPAYADYRAALDAVECATYADLLASSRSRRDRFHAEWTARMQQRCGFTQDTAPQRDEPKEALPPQRFFFPPASGGRGRRDTALQEAIDQLEAEGLTRREIAAAIGRSESTVRTHQRRRLRPLNAAPVFDAKRAQAVERRATAKRMKKRGATAREIADALGVHLATVYDLLAPESAEQRKLRYREYSQRHMRRRAEAA